MANERHSLLSRFVKKVQELSVRYDASSTELRKKLAAIVEELEHLESAESARKEEAGTLISQGKYSEFRAYYESLKPVREAEKAKQKKVAEWKELLFRINERRIKANGLTVKYEALMLYIEAQFLETFDEEYKTIIIQGLLMSGIVTKEDLALEDAKIAQLVKKAESGKIVSIQREDEPTADIAIVGRRKGEEQESYFPTDVRLHTFEVLDTMVDLLEENQAVLVDYLAQGQKQEPAVAYSSQQILEYLARYNIIPTSQLSLWIHSINRKLLSFGLEIINVGEKKPGRARYTITHLTPEEQQVAEQEKIAEEIQEAHELQIEKESPLQINGKGSQLAELSYNILINLIESAHGVGVDSLKIMAEEQSRGKELTPKQISDKVYTVIFYFRSVFGLTISLDSGTYYLPETELDKIMIHGVSAREMRKPSEVQFHEIPVATQEQTAPRREQQTKFEVEYHGETKLLPAKYYYMLECLANSRQNGATIDDILKVFQDKSIESKHNLFDTGNPSTRDVVSQAIEYMKRIFNIKITSNRKEGRYWLTEYAPAEVEVTQQRMIEETGTEEVVVYEQESTPPAAIEGWVVMKLPNGQEQEIQLPDDAFKIVKKLLEITQPLNRQVLAALLEGNNANTRFEAALELLKGYGIQAVRAGKFYGAKNYILTPESRNIVRLPNAPLVDPSTGITDVKKKDITEKRLDTPDARWIYVRGMKEIRQLTEEEYKIWYELWSRPAERLTYDHLLRNVLKIRGQHSASTIPNLFESIFKKIGIRPKLNTETMANASTFMLTFEDKARITFGKEAAENALSKGYDERFRRGVYVEVDSKQVLMKVVAAQLLELLLHNNAPIPGSEIIRVLKIEPERIADITQHIRDKGIRLYRKTGDLFYLEYNERSKVEIITPYFSFTETGWFGNKNVWLGFFLILRSRTNQATGMFEYDDKLKPIISSIFAATNEVLTASDVDVRQATLKSIVGKEFDLAWYRKNFRHVFLDFLERDTSKSSDSVHKLFGFLKLFTPEVRAAIVDLALADFHNEHRYVGENGSIYGNAPGKSRQEIHLEVYGPLRLEEKN